MARFIGASLFSFASGFSASLVFVCFHFVCTCGPVVCSSFSFRRRRERGAWGVVFCFEEALFTGFEGNVVFELLVVLFLVSFSCARAPSSGSFPLVAVSVSVLLFLFPPFPVFLFVVVPVSLAVFVEFLESQVAGVAAWLGRGVVVALSVSSLPQQQRSYTVTDFVD